MTIDRTIPIKNIYYMLTYAFKELRHNNYEYIAGESFENIYDLFAEIISKGIAYLLKQGLHKEYAIIEDTMTTLRGKLDIQGTIKEKISQHTCLVCEYDELTANNLYNAIVKTTVNLLLDKSDVKIERKRNLRKMPQFSDEHMNLLFQRFVMEYYKRHHPEYKASAKQIKWNVSDNSVSSSSMLLIMQSDITLTLDERTLIIDTKYYSRNLQEHFGKPTLHSSNIYQIHTYVMNEDKAHTGNVDGLLLYAKTATDIQPYGNFKTNDGNILIVRTMDLSRDFEHIKNDLDKLVIY